MLVIARVIRAVVVGCVAATALAGCTSDDSPSPAPGGSVIDATTMRGALLQATDIGPTWKIPQQTPAPNLLVSFCGGESTVPPVPPGATVVAAPLVDEGQKGAQTLTQTALVYADTKAAATGLADLRALADACPPTVSVPAKTGGDREEPAYTETVRTSPLSESGWSGFVLVRHKLYASKQPAIADTAVAVLAKRNVVLVDAYAVYRLGAATTGPGFTSDWQKLVGTVLSRVPA
jgi:hypothetical protein